MISPGKLLYYLYKAGDNTVNHDGIEHAGYLAFLELLALFPFLVFIVALAGFVGEGRTGAEFIAMLFSNLPPNIVSAIKPRIEEIVSGPPQGLLTVAILGAIWTSSSAVEGYRTVLNRAYHVATPPSYWWRRMLSILQLLTFSFIILIVMSLLVIVPVIWDQLVLKLEWNQHLLEDMTWSRVLWWIGAFSLLLVVSNMYYILPNIRQNFFSVIPGAIIVVMLWMVSAKLLSVYFSREQVTLIYGSLGGIIAALLFFYINNIIFIYGAELNYLLKKAIGERIVQKEATAEPQPVDDEN